MRRSWLPKLAWKPHVCCQGAKIRTIIIIIIIVDDDDVKYSKDCDSDNDNDSNSDDDDDDDDELGCANKILQKGAFEAPAGVPDMLRILPMEKI